VASLFGSKHLRRTEVVLKSTKVYFSSDNPSQVNADLGNKDRADDFSSLTPFSYQQVFPFLF